MTETKHSLTPTARMKKIAYCLLVVGLGCILIGYALKIDFEEQPPMFKISDTHYAATWLEHPDAPKMGIPEPLKSRIAAQLAREVEE